MINMDEFKQDELVIVLQELKKVKESSDNVRRGVFARLSELEKTVTGLAEKWNMASKE